MEERIKQELRQAQLMRNELVVSTLRLLLSELVYLRLQKGVKDAVSLSDEEVLAVVQKELKKRRESAEAFKKANRRELAKREEAEVAVLAKYLPQQLEEEELTRVVEEVINELGARQTTDMGRVIGAVKTRVDNAADGAAISRVVRHKLAL